MVKKLEINVNASKNYKIIIEDNLDKLKELFKEVKSSKIAIISDSKVHSLYGWEVENLIEGKEVISYEIKSGEESKNAVNYITILNFLALHNFKRTDTIVALGGGVVGDLAGFIGATYLRGVNVIMVPTTLLSMVDSSIGGKTAINLDMGKNLVGAFYQPSLVYINTSFLSTLPPREITCGLGEIVKYAFIDKRVSVDLIKNGVSKDLIYNCILAKKYIVENDEKENGIRKLLNLGHTVGHAIEKALNYTLSHGECVALGIGVAINVSNKLGVLSKENSEKAKEIVSLATSRTISFDKDELFKFIKIDKKTYGDNVDFIIIDNNLTANIKTLTLNELYNIL